MRIFANIYIVLFLVDAVVSLVDALLSHWLGASAIHTLQVLHVLQGMAALGPFLLAFPLYCTIGCMRGFPWRIPLALVVFITWVDCFAALPMPFYLGQKHTALWLAVIQAALGLWAMLALRRTSKGRSWLFEQASFAQTKFRWKRLGGFVAVNAVIVLPLLLLYAGASLSLGVAHLSHGFIHLDTKGVSVEARTYRCDGGEVYLLPTIHIAGSSFYTDLLKGLPPKQSVIIPEGVTDKKHLLPGGMGYDKLAPTLGLVSQTGKTFTKVGLPVTRCDTDISNLSPDVINYLKAISHFFHTMHSEKKDSALLKLFATPQPNQETLWKEVVVDRNHRVSHCIQTSLKHYTHVVVPWGAGHMPGIERALLKNGAVLEDQRRIRVFNWSALFQGNTGRHEKEG